MANSKYEYVRSFETNLTLLPNTYIIVRIDGRGFHKLSTKYKFRKPNDRRALELMNGAACAVMQEIPDISVSYGVSDEYSFVFHRSTRLFERRESKILTTVVSTFTSYYVHLWPAYFPEVQLSSPMPSFDGRAILYPSTRNIRDYMSWRQADCHINNLFNTTFWALVDKGGISAKEAEEELKGTLAANKNEILFSRFGINYNKELEIFRKGSVIFRDYTGLGKEKPDKDGASDSDSHHPEHVSMTQMEKRKKRRQKATITVDHCDIIQDEFWKARPELLSDG